MHERRISRQYGKQRPVIAQMRGRGLLGPIFGDTPAGLNISKALQTSCELLLRDIAEEIPHKYSPACTAVCRLRASARGLSLTL